MAGIFIGYRRDDSAGHARALFDRLRAHFGAELVFMDVTDIEPGMDFTEVLDKAIGSCDVLLAVIGREWLTATDISGRRRLDDPHDFVRFEMATALRRKIRVIPVLVQNAMLPSASVLPAEIAELAKRQSIELRDTRWEADVMDLIKALEKLVTSASGQPGVRLPVASGSSARRSVNRAAIGFLVLGSLVAAGYAFTVRWWPRPAADAPVEASPPANSGTGVADRSGPVDTVNFEEHRTGSASAPVSYTVTNSGVEPLAISSVTLLGAHPKDFAVAATDCLDAPVAPGNKCAIRVTFRPASAGTRTAGMVIADNGPGSPYTIELVGIGVSAPDTPSGAEGRKSALIPTRIQPAPAALLDNDCTYGRDKTDWTFRWSAIPGARRYHLFVAHPASVGGSRSAIDNPDLISAAYHYQKIRDFLPGRLEKGWRWRVRAQVDDAWQEWSPEQPFDVEPVDTDCGPPDPEPVRVANLTIPRQLTPVSQAVLDNGCSGDRDVVEWPFNWSAIGGASRYHLQVSRPGEPPIVDTDSVARSYYLFERRGHVDERKGAGRDRFFTWKVRAMVSGDWQPWSKDAAFEVEPANTDCSGRITGLPSATEAR